MQQTHTLPYETDAPHFCNLSAEEKRRLTLWKQKYSMNLQGFTGEEAARLVFFKWLYQQGRLAQ